MPDKEDLHPTERIAIIARALTIGEQPTTAEVAHMVGLSRQGAWEMLDKLSRVLPIVQDRTVDGRLVWHCIDANSIR